MNRLSLLCIAAIVLLTPPLSAEPRHVIVDHDPDLEMGYGSNYTPSGHWQWGDEFLFSYIKAPFYEHGPDRLDMVESQLVLARSTDGGETWAHSTIPSWGTSAETTDLPAPGMDWTHPDFAMFHEASMFLHPDSEDGKRAANGFYVSYDRGDTWSGPYRYTGLDMESSGWPTDSRQTSRIDYQVRDADTLLFLKSAKKKPPEGGPDWHNQDAVFTAMTTDRGQTWQFNDWVANDDEGGHESRYVTPSSARISDTHWVAAMRRRSPDNPDGSENNWLDLHSSFDAGQSWEFTSRIADTEPGNGNPPALLRLSDGVLACLYGLRNISQRIEVRYSHDNGQTWSAPQIIRTNPLHAQDLGYPRLYERTDGKLVAIYYWTSDGLPERHIAATIFTPEPGPAPDPSVDVITSIDAVSTGNSYEITRAVEGWRAYTDRAHIIASLPEELLGVAMIRTANDDDRVDVADHLRFTLSEEAKVYMAYRTPFDSLPSWASDWTHEGSSVWMEESGGNMIEFAVYSQVFPAGEVIMGGNDRRGATGAAGNFLVLAVPTGEDG